MISIQEHAYKIHKIFNFLDFYEYGASGYYDVPREWLNLAAGVAKIEIVPAIFDSSIYFCGPAMDYQKEKGEIWSEFTEALTIFNFSWGALESYIVKVCSINEMKPKIEPLKKYFRNSKNKGSFFQYEMVYNELYDLMKKKVDNQIPGDFNTVSYFAKGITLTVRIRNMFAHGARKLPDMDEIEGTDLEDLELVLDTKMIQLGTRLILFTIQFMLIEEYLDVEYFIEFPELFNFQTTKTLDENIPLILILNSLHLEDIIDYENLCLDLD